MSIRKYSVMLSIVFLSIFAGKMVISFAPVFFSHLDKKLMNAVIMQLEEESKDNSSKENVKFSDHKLMFHKMELHYTPIVLDDYVQNSFIEHSRRYVDPYHPTVPTPPPNFS